MDSDRLAANIEQEIRYRLRTVASHYRSAGKHGTKPSPDCITNEAAHGTRCVLAQVAAEIDRLTADRDELRRRLGYYEDGPTP